MQNSDPVSIANRQTHILIMLILAILIGIVGGIAAVVFRLMIGFFHNLFFFHHFSWYYNPHLHAPPSVWGWGIILVPPVVGLLVVWLTKNSSSATKGQGVPEVIDAINYHNGIIRPVVTSIKAIASSLSIGSGGSAGREGPIIQIGAAFGSFLGQIIKMPIRQRIILLAAGAAAGIAATFNAPISGIAFSIELLLISINAASLSIVALSTLIADYLGRLLLGLEPAFHLPFLQIPSLHPIALPLLLLFIPFGILVGCMGTLFIYTLSKVEEHFKNTFNNQYFRHFCGMLLVGFLLYVFMQYSGHYYIEGIGYATVSDILNGMLSHPWFLLLLFIAKLLATSLTLGTGGFGGIFSPALFLGATLGGAYGGWVHFVFPSLKMSLITFAIAGMAGMIGSITGAVLTAIVMLFEMTRDYNVVLPVILTVSFSYLTRTLLSRESIYALKLRQKRHFVKEGLQTVLYTGKSVEEIMSKNFFMVNIHALQSHPEVLHEKQVEGKPVVVEEYGKILGLLRPGFEIAPGHEALDHNIIFVHEQTPLLEFLRALAFHHAEQAVVTHAPRAQDSANILGVITPKEIADFNKKIAVLMHDEI